MLSLDFRDKPSSYSNGLRLYSKSDNFLYLMTPDGTELKLASSATSFQPAGEVNSIQFNDGGVFGGFGSWNGTTATINAINTTEINNSATDLLLKRAGVTKLTLGADYAEFENLVGGVVADQFVHTNQLTSTYPYFILVKTGLLFNKSATIDATYAAHYFSLNDTNYSTRGAVNSSQAYFDLSNSGGSNRSTWSVSATNSQITLIQGIYSSILNASSTGSFLNLSDGTNTVSLNEDGTLNSTLGIVLNNSLDVQGALTADSIIKSGGTSTQFLKADGSVDSTLYFPHILNDGPEDMNTDYGVGVKIFENLPTPTNSPISSPRFSTINLDGYSRRRQIAFPFNSNRMFIRHKVDATWSSWTEIASTSALSSYLLLTGGTLTGPLDVQAALTADSLTVDNGTITLASTTTLASAPTNSLFRNSAIPNRLHQKDGSGAGLNLIGNIYNQYTNVTKTGIVTQQSLAGTGTGTRTLTAGQMNYQGASIDIYLCGYYSTDSSAGNATIRLRFGSTTFRTIGSFSLDNSVTNGIWWIRGRITTKTTGATGTIGGQLMWEHQASSVAGSEVLHVAPSTSVADVTLNLTTAQTFDVDWTATDAGTSITCTCFTIIGVN